MCLRVNTIEVFFTFLPQQAQRRNSNELITYVYFVWNVHSNLILMPSLLRPAGLLYHRAPLCPSQLLQTRLGWGQQEDRTSVCAPAKFHSSGLVVQRLSPPSLASSQLSQAAGVAGGPVLCGRVSLHWFCLRAGSLRLHQQQGGSAQVIWPRFRPSDTHTEPESLQTAPAQLCCFS